LNVTVRPISQATARCRHTLLDTEDEYDAWSTGREGPESAEDGDGLSITWDGTGTVPSVSLLSTDGAVELHGVDEIRAVYCAVRTALRFAEAFGDPIPAAQWRQLNG
jgi:hypothetical protein